ncbi:hypothetical protein ABB37_05102 [Leptomonas pyrrhocoris]|uniref:Uncharacterized protein n=1 Tax=Leptomonas pyrrhocoris TaxID=157538 RepID=A0A0N1J4T3_LEPPY|nr:hypothetical protein ABB37_05102 [Leptomonas pyrrhocoris]KPA80102.1 hypothetical protein ABB37_05102 [Leptomonas pyrrhocoris]|eukprot:XP_015658541.1 hypothetical protein ABB37_05102 [Leptomonas pyrrhocoris]
MQRTAVRGVGNYSRLPVGQQRQQTSYSVSQHRSTSVLGSLIRMRSQFQRLRSSQQQQVIAAVLERNRKARYLGSKDTPLSLLSSSEGDAGVAADEEQGSSSRNVSTTIHAGFLLCVEAQRLLKGEGQSKTPLSDVAVSSPLYAAEAGKLLSTAAAFGASTTFPRVQEVCAWIRAHTDSLRTPRQIMSLCMPLVNLADGATAGVSFVLEVLYEPLLLALQEDGSGAATQAEGPSPSLSSQRMSSGEDITGSGANVEAQLVAITSAFGMVAKWSTAFLAREADTSNGNSSTKTTDAAAAALCKAEERMKMRRIAESSVAALARHTSECAGDGGSDRSHDIVYATLQQLSVGDVVLWLQCLHGVEKTYFLTTIPMAAENEKCEAMQRLLLCYRVLLPLMRHVLETTGTTAPAGAATPAAGGSFADGRSVASAATTTASVALRVQDLTDLVQTGLYSSIESEHQELALQHGLQALPRALSAATSREACLVTQVVNRVRLQRPAALSAALLRAVLAALRPRLFILRESQAYHLRPQDCSVLLSQLSRWEEVPGVTVSADIVELLSQRFGEQMPMVQGAQLVPFVQALARFEERHRRADRHEEDAATETVRRDDGTASGGVGARKGRDINAPISTAGAVASARHCRRAKTVRYFYSSTARVVAQCAQRAAVLASEEALSNGSRGGSGAPPADQLSATTDATKEGGAPRLSPTEAAQLISAFVQLSSPQVEFVFTQVEPLLTKGAVTHSSATGVSSASSPSSAAAAAAAAELYARVTLQESVIRFIEFMTQLHPREAHTSSAAQRAKVLLVKMDRTLATVVRQAARPKDLVLASSLVRHKLLDHRPIEVDGDAEDADAKLSRSHGDKKIATSWRRADVRLATCVAKQVCVVAAQCNGFEVGALTVAIGALAAAGVLPAPMTRQAMEALWTRCVEGLEAAASTQNDPAATTTAPHPTGTPVTLTLDDCKKLMDGVRMTFSALPPCVQTTIPPLVFLDTFTMLCADLSTNMTARDAATADGAGDLVRGTSRSYANALADLRRYTTLGRSIFSFFAACSSSFSSAESDTVTPTRAQQWKMRPEACRTAVEAYLKVVRVVMESYATEASLSASWWAEAPTGSSNNVRRPPAVPLELLSMTARVVTQLQRFVHLRDGAPKQRTGSAEVDAVEDRNPLVGGEVEELNMAAADEPTSGAVALNNDEAGDDEDSDGLTSDAQMSLSTIDAVVSDVLGVLGDTIALLARQQQQQSNSDASSAAEENDESNVVDANRATMNPKHLLMLLQAYETARYRHPEMLYGILPELRSSANQLDPLELSLLVRALTRLGAWNSRLLRVLATAVEAKIQTCELRQCHTLLQGLCRSGCVSPNTFVEVRGAMYEDWSRAGTRRGGAPQEPLQRLAESVLWRLDALVCTRDAFVSLAHTAELSDLVSVVTALRFFHMPPPPTYDAFVVLAVRKLVSVSERRPARKLVQHCVAILSAISDLRQPAQQRVSASAVWTVVRRVLDSGDRPSSSSAGVADDASSLPACWQLWRLASLQSLQYGREATGVLFEVSPQAAPERRAMLFSRIRERLKKVVEAYAWGPDPQRDHPTQDVGGSAQNAGDGRCGWPVLSPSGQVALHRHGLHAAPSLLRSDRDLAEQLCFPFQLALHVIRQQDDLSILVRTPLFTAPAAQAKRFVRLAACLLRADLWDSSSISAESQLLLISALQLLWRHADLHGLLCTSPEAFSTEELVVLAAAAAHLQQAGIVAAKDDAQVYGDDCTAALRQLSDAKTEWRLAAAVDAWTLFTRLTAAPANPQLRSADLSAAAGLFAVLARSGDIIVAAFLELQRASSSATRTRALHELLRLFQISGGTDISCFIRTEDAVVAPQLLSSEPSDSPVELDAERRFRQQYAEVQTCIESLLGTSSPN